MAETISTVGQLAGICGHDGTDWLKALIDAAGHLQVDLVASGGKDLGDLVTLLEEIQGRLGDETSPAAGTVNKQLADLLTELQSKLETADLNIDGAKDLQVDVKTAPVTEVTAEGGDVLLNYESSVTEHVEELNASVGQNDLSSTAVPSGKVHVYNNLCMVNANSAMTHAIFYRNHSGTALRIKYHGTLAAANYFSWEGSLFVEAGDYIVAQFFGCTAGDDLHFDLMGYQFDAP